MTSQEIIRKFELYVGDTTDLSTQEEVDLLNKVYRGINNKRHWEYLKTTATGTLQSLTGGIGHSLPSDFISLYDNSLYTDNSISAQNNASPRVLWVTLPGATDISPYQFINYADRRQYRNQNGSAYVDIKNSKFYITGTQTDLMPYELDYIFKPADLTISSAEADIVIPSQFHDILFFGMCVDDMTIQLFDKARSYAATNQAQYQSILDDLVFFNSQLQLN